MAACAHAAAISGALSIPDRTNSERGKNSTNSHKRPSHCYPTASPRWNPRQYSQQESPAECTIIMRAALAPGASAHRGAEGCYASKSGRRIQAALT
jgi:hypothetical protein